MFVRYCFCNGWSHHYVATGLSLLTGVIYSDGCIFCTRVMCPNSPIAHLPSLRTFFSLGYILADKRRLCRTYFCPKRYMLSLSDIRQIVGYTQCLVLPCTIGDLTGAVLLFRGQDAVSTSLDYIITTMSNTKLLAHCISSWGMTAQLHSLRPWDVQFDVPKSGLQETWCSHFNITKSTERLTPMMTTDRSSIRGRKSFLSVQTGRPNEFSLRP
jgi:hypothetical protein